MSRLWEAWVTGRHGLARWVLAGIVAVVLTGAACGDDDDDGDAAGNNSDATLSADPGEGNEAIVIKSRVEFPEEVEPGEDFTATGEVLAGSSIGDSPFCPGGTFRDQHGNDAIGLVDRTFRCPDGSLRIGFTPGVPQGRTQTGPWKVVSGTGAFEGLQGSGQMETKYERGSDTKGRETFTGTVVP